VKLPELSAKNEELHAIADKHSLNCYPLENDHETQFVSIKKRPECSEVQIIQDLYDGVRAMCAAEKSHRPEIKERSVEDNVGDVPLNEHSEAITHQQVADHGVGLDGPALLVE